MSPAMVTASVWAACGRRVGGARILDIMVQCSLKSVAANITGVVLGSCFSAGTADRPQAETINTLVQESNLAWVAAYNCAAFWHESTMIDLSIIRQMIRAKESHFQDRGDISEQLAMGIECFSPHFAVGSNGKSGSDGKLISLKQGVSFFSQPRGQGNRSRCVTDEVWGMWKGLQLETLHVFEEA